jgi:heterodisulfide reductase subunit C
MFSISSIAFSIFLASISFLAFKRFRRIYLNIQLGTAWTPSNSALDRLKNMVLIALGQKKMFSRPIPAIFHFFIYLAFIFTQIELFEIIIDGIFDTHRFMGHVFQNLNIEFLYIGLINFIEILSLLALIATFVFLSRRNLLKLPRFTMSELKGWPTKDANIILIGEIFLVFCIFLMNSADETNTGQYLLSSKLSFLFANTDELTKIFLSKLGWWGHVIGIFGFIIYLPFSKHLHIMLAFPNAYFSSDHPKGYMAYMPEIHNEIIGMMEPEKATNTSADEIKFGAKDVMDLKWKNLLDAYSCTECGRCTSACPANMTGKLLSPRKIMMDTRDRLEEVGKNIEKNGSFVDDGKKLLHDYISVEELRGCTTCNACVEECPVNISPLDIILQLRRNLIMEESNSPQEWNAMFGNIENNGAPWKFSPSDRGNWAVN